MWAGEQSGTKDCLRCLGCLPLGQRHEDCQGGVGRRSCLWRQEPVPLHRSVRLVSLGKERRQCSRSLPPETLSKKGKGFPPLRLLLRNETPIILIQTPLKKLTRLDFAALKVFHCCLVEQLLDYLTADSCLKQEGFKILSCCTLKGHYTLNCYLSVVFHTSARGDFEH